FTADPSIDLETINFMINMDMVGRLEKEKPLLIYGVGTSPSWRSVLDVMWVDGISGIKTMDDGIGPSDHTSFYLKNIPVLHFFTGQHQDYHKSSDDASLVNFDGIKLVGDYIVGIIDAVKDEDKLTFSKTKSTERKGAAFKVTLGVMPDYTHEGMGMKIDAVLEERPAQAAGLKDGDLIIEMDGKEIADIYTYMEVLSKHKKGDTIPVVVKRGEETVKVKVTF
ncbi:MAG: membrane-associated protease RseP (regulator of RpoE activity), partial [Gammaproteobacteria bacterium]